MVAYVALFWSYVVQHAHLAKLHWTFCGQVEGVIAL